MENNKLAVHSFAFGEAIRCAREARGISLEAMAQKIGVVSSDLIAWEGGQGPVPFSAIQGIREVLGCSYSELLDGMRSPSEKKEVWEALSWLGENNDDVADGAFGLCLDYEGLVRKVAPHWNLGESLEQKGITGYAPRERGVFTFEVSAEVEVQVKGVRREKAAGEARG